MLVCRRGLRSVNFAWQSLPNEAIEHEFRSSTKTPADPGGQPPRDGNSAALGAPPQRGAQAAGSAATLLFLDDYIKGFLPVLRHASAPDDRYAELFLEHFLPADGVLFCTPLYWYGMSAQTKAFFDRSFTHYAGAGPEPEAVKARMAGKRLGLAVASEETYPGAVLGVVHQVQEFAATRTPTSSATCTARATAAARSPSTRAVRWWRLKPSRPSSSRGNT